MFSTTVFEGIVEFRRVIRTSPVELLAWPKPGLHCNLEIFSHFAFHRDAYYGRGTDAIAQQIRSCLMDENRVCTIILDIPVNSYAAEAVCTICASDLVFTVRMRILSGFVTALLGCLAELTATSIFICTM